jgi:hypothetical protein
MTTPDERTRSLVETGVFLRRLMIRKRIPEEVRQYARWLERHYPTLCNLEAAHRALPHLFAPVLHFDYTGITKASGKGAANAAFNEQSENAATTRELDVPESGGAANADAQRVGDEPEKGDDENGARL